MPDRLPRATAARAMLGVTPEGGITALPTFKMFRNGEEVGTLEGAKDDALRELVQKLESLAQSTHKHQ